MKPIRFNTKIRAIKEEEYDKYHISKASMLEEAGSLIPEYRSLDILPILFSVAKVNRFNSNDDGITAMEAAKLLPLFPHKPINVEHSKTNIVGHLSQATFSDSEPAFDITNPIDFLEREDEFYIAGAGYVYKSIFPKLAEALINASDKSHELYNAFAASWEIGFDDYDIAVGNSDIIGQTKIIGSNDEDYESLSSLLRVNEGSGMTEGGEKVRRVLKGEKIPLGVGLTERPAAPVKGIYTIASLIDEKISKKEEIDVTTNETDIAMDKDQFNELKTLLTSLASKEDVTSPAQEAFEKINSLLSEKGADWKAKADKNADELVETKATLDEVKGELKEATEKIEALKKDAEIRDAADKLNDRMAAIANEFELEGEEEAIVAKDIAALSQDDSEFEAYLKKARVIFSHRDKEKIAAAKKEEKPEEKKEKEKPNEAVASDLETLETKTTPLLNNVGEDANGKSLLERLQQSGLVLEDN